MLYVFICLQITIHNYLVTLDIVKYLINNAVVD